MQHIGSSTTSPSQSSDAVIVRRAGPQDARFLRDMLHHAYYWKERAPGTGLGPVGLYVKGWGRAGDAGVVGLVDGFPVGAAWYRLFRADRPGYGFVDERTPELAIAVVPSARGKGVGSALLEALLASARADGHAAVSLSVDRNNRGAIELYQRHGFSGRADAPDGLTMVADLSAEAAGR